VHTRITAITSILEQHSAESQDLSQLKSLPRQESLAWPAKSQAAIEVANTPAQYDLQMLDPITGVDKSVTVDWESALALRTLKSRVRPYGYWIAGSSKWLLNVCDCMV
jgi:hypothetical protein